MAHSMGNIVAGEALRQAGAVTQVVNTYVAMQGAVPLTAMTRRHRHRIYGYQTPDRYAHYWTDSMPCYFNDTAGAGTYVNFFNTNDYALAIWQVDQNFKPDFGANYGYGRDQFFPGHNLPQHGEAIAPSRRYLRNILLLRPATLLRAWYQPGIGGAFDDYRQV